MTIRKLQPWTSIWWSSWLTSFQSKFKTEHLSRCLWNSYTAQNHKSILAYLNEFKRLLLSTTRLFSQSIFPQMRKLTLLWWASCRLFYTFLGYRIQEWERRDWCEQASGAKSGCHRTRNKWHQKFCAVVLKQMTQRDIISYIISYIEMISYIIMYMLHDNNL